MLPAPKHGSITTKQLTPQVLARPPPPKPAPKQPLPKPRAPAVPQPTTLYPWEQDDGDDIDTTEEAPNFFTFSEPPLLKVNLDSDLHAAASVPPAASAGPVTASAQSKSSEPEPQPSFNVEPGPEVQPPLPSRKGKIVYAEPEEPGTSVYDVELDDGAVSFRLSFFLNELECMCTEICSVLLSWWLSGYDVLLLSLRLQFRILAAAAALPK